MIDKLNVNFKVASIRGATTATGNSVNEIENAVEELINELVKSESNIRDDKFQFGNDEINLKSSLIIYFLSKKLELL